MTGPLGKVLGLLETTLGVLVDPVVPCCPLDPVCRTAVYPAGVSVPWDSCGEGGCGDRDGMLWAQLTALDPVQGGSDSGNCPAYMWTATVGIVRCVSVLGEDGQPPTAAQVAADADRQITDADAIWHALRCCPTRPEALADVSLSSWRPLGPLGGCAGGTWTMRGRFDACC